MNETKTGRIPANVTPTSKEAFEKIASELGDSAGGLAGKLIDAYIAAKKEHGNQLFYPPKFHTFESIKIQEEMNTRQKKRDAFEKAG